MADSKKQLQEALVEGATKGLTGEALFLYARKETKAKSKKIVHAAFFALSDPDLKDRKVLDALYSLGLSHRLGEDDDGSSDTGDSPASKAATLPLPERVKKKRARKDR